LQTIEKMEWHLALMQINLRRRRVDPATFPLPWPMRATPDFGNVPF
jgi:hypothetical protein